MNDIGKRIKEKRLELGLSQEELAKIVGFSSRSSINKIELGTREIGQHKIVAFSKALHISISELMGWERNLTTDSAEFTANLIRSDNLNEKFMKYVLELADMDNETQNKVFEYMDFIRIKKGE